MTPSAVPARALLRALRRCRGAARAGCAGRRGHARAGRLRRAAARRRSSAGGRARCARGSGASAWSPREPRTGTPRAVAKLDGFLTGPSGRPAADVALAYVREHAGRVRPGRRRPRRAAARPPHGGRRVEHLTWEQRYRGIPSADTQLQAAVTASGRLLGVTGAPAPDLAVAVDRAVGQRRARIRGGRAARAIGVERRGGGAEQATAFADGGRASLALYQDGDGARLGLARARAGRRPARSTTRSSTRGTGRWCGAPTASTSRTATSSARTRATRRRRPCRSTSGSRRARQRLRGRSRTRSSTRPTTCGSAVSTPRAEDEVGDWNDPLARSARRRAPAARPTAPCTWGPYADVAGESRPERDAALLPRQHLPRPPRAAADRLRRVSRRRPGAGPGDGRRGDRRRGPRQQRQLPHAPRRRAGAAAGAPLLARRTRPTATTTAPTTRRWSSTSTRTGCRAARDRRAGVRRAQHRAGRGDRRGHERLLRARLSRRGGPDHRRPGTRTSGSASTSTSPTGCARHADRHAGPSGLHLRRLPQAARRAGGPRRRRDLGADAVGPARAMVADHAAAGSTGARADHGSAAPLPARAVVPRHAQRDPAGEHRATTTRSGRSSPLAAWATSPRPTAAGTSRRSPTEVSPAARPATGRSAGRCATTTAGRSRARTSGSPDTTHRDAAGSGRELAADTEPRRVCDQGAGRHLSAGDRAPRRACVTAAHRCRGAGGRSRLHVFATGRRRSTAPRWSASAHRTTAPSAAARAG